MSKFSQFNRKGKNAIKQGANDLFHKVDDFIPESFQRIRETIWDTFKIDVRETINEYIVEAELPGIQKEAIDISLNDGRLTITVQGVEDTETKEEEYIYKERKTGAMQRSLYLHNATPEMSKAQLEDGILSITVPKDTHTDPATKISIE